MKKLTILLILLFFGINGKSQTTNLTDETRLNLDSIYFSNQSLDSLTRLITSVELKSKLNQVFTLSYWISKHIRYDNEGLINGYWHKQTFDKTLATKVIEKGKTICGGYAMLAKTMFDQIGVENEIIVGTAKGRNYDDSSTNENHAWNAVKIDSTWYIFDLTWSSPKKEHQKVNEFYFNPNPELLISTHYPNEHKWTLLDKKYTREQFTNMPRVNANFFKFGLSNSIPTIIFDTNQISFDLSNNFDGNIGIILHEKGTYNSDIIEYTVIKNQNSQTILVPIPDDNKTYKLEVTYISANPMLKHFELLTVETKNPVD
ncbi:MAG: transglutaminase domain-containing protein [Saprospiraceae bacterium]